MYLLEIQKEVKQILGFIKRGKVQAKWALVTVRIKALELLEGRKQ